MTIYEVLHMGLEHQCAGRLPQAEAIYREVLGSDPVNADALHLLGMVAFQCGRLELAADYIGQAIRVNSQISPFHNNLGNVLRQLSRLDEAVRSYEEALRLAPGSIEAHINLGNALQDQGRFAEAAQACRQALALMPGSVEAHNNLGNALLGLRRTSEALAEFDRALELNPDYAEAWVNRAAALKELEQLEEAEASCREAIRRRPGLAPAHSNLAAVQLQQERLEEAEASCREALRIEESAEAYSNLAGVYLKRKKFEEAETHALRALALNPRDAGAQANRAGALHGMGRLEEAMEVFRLAIELDPRHATAHYGLGNCMAGELRTDEALACYSEALRLKPGDVSTHMNRGLLLLAQGEFAEGWREYEWRRRKKEYQRKLPGARWDGEDPWGKTILLYAEQGLGDTLQFVRYAPLVRRMGARVVLECPARLIPLLASFEGYDWLVAGTALPEFDLYAPLPSLPGLMGTRVENIPAEIPYLKADPELVAHWGERMKPFTGYRVGLVWTGNPDNGDNRKRSIPPEKLAVLAEVPGVTLFSLQRGRPAEEAGKISPRVVKIEDEAAEITDTAAIIKNLDLLISADTMPAHLAGALGTPVWTLLAYAPDFRWMLEREDSPWYPSMRLFRQPRRGDWDAVIASVAAELAERLRCPAR